jgi:hypothetical protein
MPKSEGGGKRGQIKCTNDQMDLGWQQKSYTTTTDVRATQILPSISLRGNEFNKLIYKITKLSAYFIS